MATNTHRARAANDYGRPWPGIAAIMTALFVICGYGSRMDLAYLAGLAVSAAGVLYALFHLMHRRPKSAMSWLLPWTAYIFLMLPLAYPARIAAFDAGNSIRFFVHEEEFEKAPQAAGNKATSNQLWRLGIQGADEIFLLYSETSDPALADRLLNKGGSCSTRTKQVKTHFQIITISC